MTYRSTRSSVIRMMGRGSVPTSIDLEWNNISNVPVSNASSFSDWNTFFDLPNLGSPFTSVSIQSNTVSLIGSSGFTLKNRLFELNSDLISVVDNNGLITDIPIACFAECTSVTSYSFPSLLTMSGGGSNFYLNNSITTFSFPNLTTTVNYSFGECASVTEFNFPNLVTIGSECFTSCPSVTSYTLPEAVTAGDFAFNFNTSMINFNLPKLTSIGRYGFESCLSAELFYLPLCENMGSDVMDDTVFQGISGQTITITVPSALMTCNSGAPHASIQLLQANNSVTVITV